MSDISGFKTLNAGLEPLLTDIGIAVKNGKDVVKDLPLVVSLIKNFSVLAAAVGAIKEIEPEFKALDTASVGILVQDYYDMVSRVVSAIKAA